MPMAESLESASKPPLVYFIVGEPSGDQIGSHLISALLHQSEGNIATAGIGGPAMATVGLESLFPIDLFSVMGLDFLPGIWQILRRMRQLEDDIVACRPDCIVMIDAQTLSQKMAARLQPLNIPLVQYVAPTVWAWRAGRAKSISRHLRHLLTIFPFEAHWFEAYGLSTTFVGHPAAEPDPPIDEEIESFRLAHLANTATPTLALLPGSRRKEVRRHLPLYRTVMQRLIAQGMTPTCLVPLVRSVADYAKTFLEDWPSSLVTVPAEQYKHVVFAISDAALAASGTVTVELAVAGTPTVVCYKVPWHEGMVARLIINTPHVSAINILAAAEIMPEYALDRCTPDGIVSALAPLLRDPSLRAEHAKRIRDTAAHLSVPGQKPSDIAARAILRIINEAPEHE